MKKLLLASVASAVLPQATELFAKNFSEMVLGVVPTAANGQRGDKVWLTDELEALKAMDFTLTEINLEGKKEEELRQSSEGVDALYVTGGNTYYLLHHTRASGFDAVVKRFVEHGGVYIGSSAGALLACPTIDIARRFDDPSVIDIDDFTGLNLVDFLVLPHAGIPKYEEAFKAAEQEWRSKGYEVVTLTDSQGLLIQSVLIGRVDKL